jgi:hypothetical protein
MTPLTDKRLTKVLEKANHRWVWYHKTYPWKPPVDCSKRFWEAMAGVVRGYSFSILEVLNALEADRERYSLELERIEPYKKRALIRFGV